MKKVLLLIFALVLVLVCVSIAGCAAKGLVTDGNTIHIPVTDGAGGDITLQGFEGGVTPEDFGDMPIYPGCKQLMKVVGEEELDGQPGVLDHRMYITSDSVDKVIKFYKEKMPANGWTEESWYESTLNMGTYNKGEKSFAVVSVIPADDEGGTNITLEKKYAK